MVLKSGAPSTIAHAPFNRTSLASLLLTKQTSTVSVRCWRTPLVELRLRQRPSREVYQQLLAYPTDYYGQRLPARQCNNVLGSKACFAAFGETDFGGAIHRASSLLSGPAISNYEKRPGASLPECRAPDLVTVCSSVDNTGTFRELQSDERDGHSVNCGTPPSFRRNARLSGLTLCDHHQSSAKPLLFRSLPNCALDLPQHPEGPAIGSSSARFRSGSGTECSELVTTLLQEWWLVEQIE